MRWILSAAFLASLPLSAQNVIADPSASQTKQVAPVISTVTISPDTVSDLRLKPFYAATIRMPETVSSVVVGAPTLFSAEHSEREPNLVIVKPITADPAVSNLLISTKSGQAVSLRIISDGGGSTAEPVDFVLSYRTRKSFLIAGGDDAPVEARKRADTPYELAYERQARASSPSWIPTKGSVTAALGLITSDTDEMVVAFSVLNTTDHWVELLPPQVELANPNGKKTGGKGDKKLLADHVAIREFRLSERKLAPGARADGVVRFERPDFKQYQESLQLELATADAVNRPLLIALPFTAPPSEARLQTGR